MKVEKWDSATARIAMGQTERALADVADQLGVVVKVKRGRYDGGTLTVTIELSAVSADGTVETAEASAFRQFSEALFGVPADALGKIITTSNGEQFRLTGLKPNAPRFPFTAARVKDGKSFKLSHVTVRTALSRAVV